MTAPIEWHEVGTITFRDFEDGDRELRRPKFGQIRYFQRQVREIGANAGGEIGRLRDEFEQAQADEDEERLRKLTGAMRELNDFGIAEAFVPWYRELFAQLSQGLPDDADEWPGYFADASLPKQITEHWKMRPKASGETTQT